MSESAKRHEENSNLIKEIRATTDVAIRNQGASIKTLEIQIGSSQVDFSLIEADSQPISYLGSPQYAVITGTENSTDIAKITRKRSKPDKHRLPGTDDKEHHKEPDE
ncbi:hypothetical protein Tco_1008021 [Tanacetum coccineum]